MSSTIAASIGPNTVSVYINGEYFTADSTQPNFKALVAELRKKPRDVDAIMALVDIPTFMAAITCGRVEIGTNELRFKGEPVTGYMAEKLVAMLDSQEELDSWAAFMDNVMDNPDPSVRDDLYKWMEVGKMPITPDGHLIAFKKVRSDFKDVHSGRFDNSPGQELEMDRALCDPNRNNTCSTGFHFCSVGYLSGFSGERVVVVRINPRDVTAIPADYNNQKARCCRYVVERELSHESAARNGAWAQHNVLDLADPKEFPDILMERKGKLPSEIVPEAPAPVEKTAKAEKLESGVKAIAKKPRAASKKAPTKKAPVEKLDKTPKVKSASKKKSSNVSKAGTATPTSSESSVSSREFKNRGATFTVAQISEALAASGGVTPASRSLGVPRTTLHGWVATLRKEGLLP